MTRNLSDIELEALAVAYLDDQLSDDERAVADVLRAGDTSQGQHFVSLLAELDVNFSAAQAVLEGLGEQPVPVTTPIVRAPQVSRSQVLRAGAVGLTALMLFGGGFWMGQGGFDRGMSWQESIAAYQALYGPQTVAGIVLSDEERQQGLAQAQGLIGFAAPDMQRLADEYGLSFRRAQVLEHRGLPIAQLVFSDQHDRAFALCISPTNDDFAQSQKNRVLSGLNTRSWQTQNLQFMLVGRLDVAVLERFESELRAP